MHNTPTKWEFQQNKNHSHSYMRSQISPTIAYIPCIILYVEFPPKVEHHTKIKYKITGSKVIRICLGHFSFPNKVISLHVLVELFLSKSLFNFMIKNDISSIFLYNHCSPSRGYPKKSLMSFSPAEHF